MERGVRAPTRCSTSLNAAAGRSVAQPVVPAKPRSAMSPNAALVSMARPAGAVPHHPASAVHHAPLVLHLGRGLFLAGDRAAWLAKERRRLRRRRLGRLGTRGGTRVGPWPAPRRA